MCAKGEATASAELSAGAGLSFFMPRAYGAFKANNGALPRYPARALRALDPQLLKVQRSASIGGLKDFKCSFLERNVEISYIST